MIRKIIFTFIVLFIITWIVIAHLAKSKVISFINNSQSDNVRISYKDASVAGFPFHWTVRFASPKITIVNQSASREISSDYLNCVFNYKLNNVQLEFGKTLHYSTHTEEKQTEFELHNPVNLVISATFNKSLYKLDKSYSLSQVIHNIHLNSQSFSALNRNKDELFNLSDVNLDFQKNQSELEEKMLFKIAGTYKSDFIGHKISNANLLLDVSYSLPSKTISENLKYDRKIEIASAKLNLDDTSCDAKGHISLSRSNMPFGKISIEMVHYDDLVDMIVPDDFILSKPYLKKIVAKAAAIEFSNEISNKVNFDIDFSENGIAFGKVNFLDLK